MRRIESHANYQRELRARSRAGVVGCLVVVAAICVVACGMLAAYQAYFGG